MASSTIVMIYGPNGKMLGDYDQKVVISSIIFVVLCQNSRFYERLWGIDQKGKC